MCVPIVGSPAFSFWRRRLGRMVSFPPAIGALTTSVVRAGHARNLGGATCRRRREPMRRALHQVLRKRCPAERLTNAERIERGCLGTLLRLTLLAPDIMEGILDGRQPEAVTLPRLLQPC